MPNPACCKAVRRQRRAGLHRRRAQLAGPGELLQHYGTDEQDYYLPRLAVGKEIPASP